MNQEIQQQVIDGLKTIMLKLDGLSINAWDIMVKGEFMRGVGILALFLGFLISTIVCCLIFKKKWSLDVFEDQLSLIGAIISVLLGAGLFVSFLVMAIEGFLSLIAPEYVVLKNILEGIL